MISIRTLTLVAIIGFFLSVVGCGREAPTVSLTVERVGWDTLQVSIALEVRGEEVPVDERPIFRLFDDAYNLLYEGHSTRIAVPDDTLASEERLVLEACVEASGAVLCDQRPLTASPKRVVFRERLTYPHQGRYDRGAYAFDFVVERQSPDTTRWEPLPRGRVQDAYLVASVKGHPETMVRAPVSASRGSFDLSRDPNYAEFEFRLLRSLHRGESVPVRIDLYSADTGTSAPLASLERVVREKTESEREQELEQYVRSAAEQILAHFEPYDRARAHVVAWDFEEETRRYVIDVRLSWGGAFFDRQTVRGMLTVSEDGSMALFREEGMNRAARRIWRDRVGDEEIALGSLRDAGSDTEEESEDEPVIARRL